MQRSMQYRKLYCELGKELETGLETVLETANNCNVCHRHDQNFDEKFEMCDVKIEEKRWPT